MLTVCDSSALLAFVRQEPGASLVEAALLAGASCSAVTWSEVAQKVRARDRDWALVRALLHSYGLRVEPVTLHDAERAAATWERGTGLSLADRLCLALGERLESPVITADRAWGSSSTVRQIR